ncbi:MAG: hypothetical protein NC930_04895 [Candidatus Omnitrophica bacterium]|nr:hypothetical protein [Candidatus Omnitrophota bacterium]
MINQFKKVTCLLTSLVFLTTNLSWGMPQVGIEIVPPRETPGFLHVEIPEGLASIEEIYEAPPSSDPRMILHIQNAHGNYEAQVKIKKLLDYLYKTYSFKLFFVEGAVEKLNADYLRLFPDKERNLALADYLAQKGELTGTEYYMMDAPKDVQAFGVEQADLYRANYDLFKKVYQSKEDVDNFLSIFEARLERASSRFQNPETRRLVSEWKRFEQGHRDFLPYVKRLAIDARKILSLDLESLFAQVEWPQLTRLLVLQSMEKELDRTQADKEKIRLLEFLKSKGISKKIINAIQTLEEKRITMSRLSTEEARLDYLPRYLLERLVEEAGPKGFYFHNYPAFSLYAGYLILKSELESKTLFDEIGLLFEKILNEVTVSEQEKNLLELFRDHELLKKLLRLEVTRKEWVRAYYRHDWIQPETMVKRLVHLESGSVIKEPVDALPPAKLDGVNLSQIRPVFDSSFRFYDLARQREAVFYNSIRDEMTRQKTNKAILVTGGFHTDGLMEIFREDKISYGILLPKISQKIDNSNYISAMLENRPTMFDLATIEAIQRLQSQNGRIRQGGNEIQEIKFLLEAYGEVGKFESPEQLVESLNYFNQSPYGKDRGIRLELVDKTEVKILVNNHPLTTEAGNVLTIPIHVARAKGEQLRPVTLARNVKQGPIIPKGKRFIPPAPPTAGVFVSDFPAPVVAGRAETRVAGETVVPKDLLEPGKDNPQLGYDENLVRIFASMGADFNVEATVAFVAGNIWRPSPRLLSELLTTASAMRNLYVPPHMQNLMSSVKSLARSDKRGALGIVSQRFPSLEETLGFYGLLGTQVNQQLDLVVIAPDRRTQAELERKRDELLADRRVRASEWKDVMGRKILDERFRIHVVSRMDIGRFLPNLPNMLLNRFRKAGLIEGPMTAEEFQRQYYAVLYDSDVFDQIETAVGPATTLERDIAASQYDVLTASAVLAVKVTQSEFKAVTAELLKELFDNFPNCVQPGRRSSYTVNTRGLERVAELWREALAQFRLAVSA